MIVIVEGCGTNITSVQFALERIGKKACVTTDVKRIQSASHVILPGVNTASRAMAQLQQRQLTEVIRHLKQPVLGICSGMQILYDHSEEGDVACLKIFPGEIASLPAGKGLTVPHMGWNQLQWQGPASSLVKGINTGSYVYFVHSYVSPLDEKTQAHTLATAHYGLTFSAIVQQHNFYGVQFHPERSGQVGEKVLHNFLTLE